MKKRTVTIYEIYSREIEIEAETDFEAIELAKNQYLGDKESLDPKEFVEAEFHCNGDISYDGD